jgi:hypothetical protein
MSSNPMAPSGKKVGAAGTGHTDPGAQGMLETSPGSLPLVRVNSVWEQKLVALAPYPLPTASSAVPAYPASLPPCRGQTEDSRIP